MPRWVRQLAPQGYSPPQVLEIGATVKIWRNTAPSFIRLDPKNFTILDFSFINLTFHWIHICYYCYLLIKLQALCEFWLHFKHKVMNKLCLYIIIDQQVKINVFVDWLVALLFYNFGLCVRKFFSLSVWNYFIDTLSIAPFFFLSLSRFLSRRKKPTISLLFFF